MDHGIPFILGGTDFSSSYYGVQEERTETDGRIAQTMSSRTILRIAADMGTNVPPVQKTKRQSEQIESEIEERPASRVHEGGL